MSRRRAVTEQVGQLATEVQLCLSRGVSWRDRWRLGRDTALFHLANYRKELPASVPVHRYHVRVGGSAIEIALRPYAGDFFVFHEVFGSRVYELPTAFKSRIRTVVDLGAHVGMTSLFLLDLLTDCQCVCVEPSPENFHLLRANLDAYADRVTLVEGAVAERSGSIAFDANGWSWGGKASDSGSRSNRVRAFTVDEIVENAGLDSIDLLKMDVEGAEDGIFRSSRRWMEKVGCIAIEIHEPYSLERFCRDVEPLGMRVLEPYGPHGNRVIMAVRHEWLAPMPAAVA